MKNPSRANIFMLVFLLYQIALSFTLAFFVDNINDALLLPVTQLLVFSLPILLYKLASGKSVPALMPVKKLDLTNAGLIILICVALMPAMMFVSALSSYFFDNNVSVMLNSMSAYPFLYVMICMALIPAVLEEITFRGLLLTGYKNINIKKAALINGLFFGMFHLSLTQFFYAFFMGCVFAYFVYYTKSILSSILAHFFINGVQLGLYYLTLGLSAGEAAATEGNMVSSILSIAIIALIFLPVAVILMRTFISYNRQKNARNLLTSEIDSSDTPPLAEEFSKKEPERVFTWAFWVYTVVFAAFVTLMLTISS